jgi:hypothetical protein
VVMGDTHPLSEGDAVEEGRGGTMELGGGSGGFVWWLW